jgi:hypothetical protein
MPQPTNALAPQPSNRLLDYIVQNTPAQWFPTAGRVFLESMQGKRDPITEADFSPDELKKIRQVIESTQGRGNVQYKDYVNQKRKMLQEEILPLVDLPPSILAITNPLGNTAATLGRFKYVRDADGNLRAIDAYDFNPTNMDSYSPYAILRRYAGEKMPPGTGRSVNINLGK